MAKTDVTNSGTEVHTNEQLLCEWKDESSLASQLTKQTIAPRVNRAISGRKRRSRRRRRKNMSYKRMATSTSKPSQGSSSLPVVSTTTDLWNDIGSVEYTYSLKEVDEQEKINTMDHKQQWQPQLLDDFENFNELEQMVRLYEESEQINETEAICALIIQLKQETHNQQITQMENKENILFFAQ